MLVSIETGLSEIADALIESPLDDGFRAEVVGVCGGESQAEGVVLQVIPNSLRHLNGIDMSIWHYQDDCSEDAKTYDIVGVFLAQDQLEFGICFRNLLEFGLEANKYTVL